ncbi:branched-chain amino acid ABC transporter permease [bacterium]|nr:MAG: branched-chain amino acid ABC transporter permease [bacterium]
MGPTGSTRILRMVEEIKIFMSVCINSFSLGSIYCLLALSYVLIYKGTKVLNLCQGEIMMLGAYLTYSAMHLGLPFGIAVLVSLVLTCAFSVLLEKSILRKVVGKPIFISIMVTVGLGILLRGVIGMVWGVDQKVLDVPYFEGMPDLPGLHMSYGKLSTILMAVLFIIILQLFFKLSRVGMAMRAMASDLGASMIMGINFGTLFPLTWVLAAIVSVFTGVVLARLTILEPGLSQYAFVALSALVLGGTDSIIGAIVGGYAIGIAEHAAVFYIGGQSKSLSGFFVMFLILIIRPYGLFGTKKVERV